MNLFLSGVKQWFPTRLFGPIAVEPGHRRRPVPYPSLTPDLTWPTQLTVYPSFTVLVCVNVHVQPNHQRWHAKWKLSWNTYTSHARLCTVGTDSYAHSVLVSKISASELSRKLLIKGALLVGHLLLSPVLNRRRASSQRPSSAATRRLGLGIPSSPAWPCIPALVTCQRKICGSAAAVEKQKIHILTGLEEDQVGNLL